MIISKDKLLSPYTEYDSNLSYLLENIKFSIYSFLLLFLY
nr:MAG TPA: hypothetical protein [Caudoviricetes sp.]DAS77522.1 MAG TPA: hypothetical protein [Caudoviricetes sp.]